MPPTRSQTQPTFSTSIFALMAFAAVSGLLAGRWLQSLADESKLKDRKISGWMSSASATASFLLPGSSQSAFSSSSFSYAHDEEELFPPEVDYSSPTNLETPSLKVTNSSFAPQFEKLVTRLVECGQETWTNPVDAIFPSQVVRNNSFGIEPAGVENLLSSCNASNALHSRKLFEMFLDSHLEGENKCTSPVSLDVFLCLSSCSLHEPELERTVRDMRLAEHGAIEHVVSGCLRGQWPYIVWIQKGSVRYLRCSKEDVALDSLLESLKFIRGVTCAVDFSQQDFVFGFDPQYFATPTFGAPSSLFQYVQPLSGLIRYVITKAHPGMLFPTTSHLSATAHCRFRSSHRWWKVCSAYGRLRDENIEYAILKSNSSASLTKNWDAFWRGPPSLLGQTHLSWRHDQRARLVREFGRKPGFDVGFNNHPHHQVLNKEAEYQEEWVVKKEASWDGFLSHAFLIHLDGIPAGWSVSQKLNSGSTVLWVESDHDYREHHYLLFKPWVHYVPIAVDMSDLEAAKTWLMENPHEAHRIAARAAAFIDVRLRAQDLWCYVSRLLMSIAKAQSRQPRCSQEVLEKFLGEKVKAFEEVKA